VESLALVHRPPLFQKEVTLGTITPCSENLETDETNETVFSRSTYKSGSGGDESPTLTAILKAISIYFKELRPVGAKWN
jgi:hypothetical protein